DEPSPDSLGEPPLELSLDSVLPALLLVLLDPPPHPAITKASPIMHRTAAAKARAEAMCNFMLSPLTALTVMRTRKNQALARYRLSADSRDCQAVAWSLQAGVAERSPLPEIARRSSRSLTASP